MTDYTVRTKKKVKSIDDGHQWSESLPDSMFASKFNFDGHGYDLRRKEYELFWYPKTLKSGTELLALLDKQKMTASLEVFQNDE